MFQPPFRLLGFGQAADCDLAQQRLLSGKHLPALDAVRGLAILLVTYFRFAGGAPGIATTGSGLPLHGIAQRGVELFFVLSGLLITGILYDAKGQQHYFRNFYARRTLRIFPLYYGVLLLALVILPSLSSLAASWYPQAREHQGWLWLYGANVLQSVRGEWCLGWFDHFWSLAVEEHFYLFWPFVIFALSRRQALVACWALVVVSIGSRVAWAMAGGNPVAPEVFTLFRLDAIALGSAVALLVRGPGGLARLIPAAKVGLAASFVVLLICEIVDRRIFTIPHSFWGLFFASGIVLLLAARPGSLLARCGESRLLRFFGRYSYGMYVFQCLLIPALAGLVTAPALAQRFGSAALGQFAYFVVMFTATLGLAVVSWYGYEKHFLKLKSRFEGSAKAPASSPAPIPRPLHL